MSSKYPIPWEKKFDKNKKYIWISEKGENTCEECKRLNGKIFTGDEVPPRPHPNCKCEVKELSIPLNKKDIERYLTIYIESDVVRNDPVLKQQAKKNILYAATIHSLIHNQPNAYTFFNIFVQTPEGIKYTEKYAKKININQESNIKRKQYILNRVHSEMPEIKNFNIYEFSENSNIARDILKSYGLKEYFIKHQMELRLFNTINSKNIEFANNDRDLYSTFHGVNILNMKIDKSRNFVTCEIHDFYNFNKDRKSFKGKIGLFLQETGLGKPYYVIIKLKIPRQTWRGIQ